MRNQAPNVYPWTGVHLRLPTKSLFVAGLICASLASTLRVEAANILVNGDFESGFDSWTQYGSGGNVVESQVPNHSGVRVSKNWGCWCAPTNQTGLYQEIQSSQGSTYTAGGWIFSRDTDYVGTMNSGFFEVWFLDSGGTALAKYRSDSFVNGTTASTWIYFSVTNQVSLTTDAITGTVASMAAPAGTAKVRFRTVYQQIDGGGGACHYDDVELNQTGGNLPPSIANISPDGSALFNAATSGFSFKAQSTTANINNSGIKVNLNGLDVSASLQISGPANDRTVLYDGLKSNRTYTATITVTDEVGFQTSASKTFDTFVAGNFIWEAEDYDFDGGLYINNPIVTSSNYVNSYFGKTGVSEVDFHDPTWGGNGNQSYRDPGFGPGTEYCADILRQKFADAIAAGDTNVHDYNVGWTYGGLSGDWMNFTRNFPAGTYNIYARVSGGGGVSKVGLWKVTSGVGTPTQTTTSLGTFVYNSSGWQSWQWVPLTDANGNLASVALNGVTTLRTAGDNANENFFMLAPARDDLPLISNVYPTGTKPFESANALTFNASSSVATIPVENIAVTLNGLNVTPLLVIGNNATNRSVSLPVLASNAMYTATINVTDSAGTFVSRSISFDTFSESNYSFEAEDFDFGGGQHIDNPVLSTFPGTDNYYQQTVPAQDYIDLVPNNLAGQEYAYRYDSAGTQVTSDYLRQRYVTAQGTDPGVKDYNVGWDVGGTWFNYTRTYPAGNYWIYGRLAGSGVLSATMDRVTAGLGTSNQTLVALGTFSATNPTDAWQFWKWVPLVNTNTGSFATFTGGAVGTLRFTTAGNVNHNFLMLVPAKSPVSLTCARNGGNTTISFPSQAGASYTIWYKNSLQDASWSYLTMVGGDGTTKTVTDATANGSSRYYRATIQ